MNISRSNFKKNISVVVQGPILPFQTAICLKSIRKFLPKAEIILSTWEVAISMIWIMMFWF